MKFEMLGWESAGLRCPDVTIDFQNHGDVHHVSLLQMPNGTGKTTTLTMIRAALTGDAERWNPSQVRELRRPTSTNTDARFICRLKVDDKPLTFDLTLDFDDGVVHYRTTYGSGIKEGHEPPPHVTRFLNEKFIDLFVFDGEYAQRLLDRDTHEAENAIDALFQLYLFHELKSIINSELEDILKNKASKGITAKTEQGLIQKQNREREIKERIECGYFQFCDNVSSTNELWDNCIEKAPRNPHHRGGQQL